MARPALHDCPAEQHWCIDLSGEQHPVSVARAFAEVVLRGWGVRALAREDVVLVVSELVANARLHTAGPHEVALGLGTDQVRVEVTDGTTAMPERRPASPDRPGGHGLLVVERLSTRWGTDVRPFGKSVWAECPLRPRFPEPGH
ncbi:ATP-binding protein [Kitasatospora sp. NPDC051984]|uniref:ATP-binding protein n=1 Tax=unclassified Kitasatospora TaxID=2633591 RepID=UPI003721B7DF